MKRHGLRKLMSSAMAALMLVPVTGAALTTGLTAMAADGEESQLRPAPQNFTVSVSNMPFESDGSTLARGAVTTTLAWDDLEGLDTCEFDVYVTVSSGEDKKLMECMTICEESEYVPPEYAWTVSNGRASYNIDLPTLGENDEQVIDGDWVNAIKENDTVKVRLYGYVEDDGYWYETEMTDFVDFPAVADSNGKTFPQTGPDLGWAVPGNVKVYIDTLPLSADGESIVPGITQNYVSWNNDDDVFCYEIAVLVTTPEGQKGWIAQNTLSRAMFETDENGRNYYRLQYEVVAPGDQEFTDGFVNGAVAGDTVEVFMAAVVKVDNTFYETKNSDAVGYTLEKDILGTTFPVQTVPVAPDWSIPQNFKATPIEIPTDDNGIVKKGEMKTLLTWDDIPRVDEGEIIGLVTLSSGEKAYFAYNTIIRGTGEGGGSVEWTTNSSTHRNSYVLVTPTLDPGEEQVVEYDFVNGLKQGDTIEIFAVSLVFDGQWLMSEPSNSVEFTVTKENLNVTFPIVVEPQTPENVEVVINSMTRGTMIADHFGELEGTVVNMSVSFDKQEGIKEYFVAPIKADGYKAATGNMPFVVVTGAGSYWNSGEGGVFVGPNGETITFENGRITVEVNVMMYDTAPQYSFMGYVEGEDIIMAVVAESSELMMSSDEVLVPVPCKKSSIGVVYPLGLTNDSVIDSDFVTLGDTFTVECAATGGTAPYQFEIKYKKATSEKYTTVQPYSSYDLITLKPAAAVAYDILVNAKDSTGKVASKEFRVNVYKPLENLSVISDTEIIKGSTVTINASAKGGKAPYKYEVTYKKESSTKYTKVQSYKTNNTIKITPTAAVTYDVHVNVMDANGTITGKDFKVKVNNPLANTSTLSASQIEFGSSIKIRASSTGGIGTKKYAVYYKKSTLKDWHLLKDYSTATVYTLKPSTAVTFDIRVDAKDEKGTVVSKTLTFKVRKDLSNDSTISAETVAVKKELKVLGKASGGTEPYEFSFFYKKASRTDWHELFDYDEKNLLTIKFNVATTYDVRVDIRDAEGTVVSTTFRVKVTNS